MCFFFHIDRCNNIDSFLETTLFYCIKLFYLKFILIHDILRLVKMCGLRRQSIDLKKITHP